MAKFEVEFKAHHGVMPLHHPVRFMQVEAEDANAAERKVIERLAHHNVRILDIRDITPPFEVMDVVAVARNTHRTLGIRPDFWQFDDACQSLDRCEFMPTGGMLRCVPADAGQVGEPFGVIDARCIG